MNNFFFVSDGKLSVGIFFPEINAIWAFIGLMCSYCYFLDRLKKGEQPRTTHLSKKKQFYERKKHNK